MRESFCPRNPKCLHRRGGGFTLVEIVLAVGILSFAIIAILGLFGTLNQRAAETADRRAAVGAMDALSNELRHKRTFATVFGWAKATDPKELVFVRYRADSTGQPVATGGTQVRASWFELPVAREAEYEAAREGRWVGARLTPSPTLNPIDPASLPATADLYNKATLVFDADLFIVPTPDLFPDSAPILSGAVAVPKTPTPAP